MVAVVRWYGARKEDIICSARIQLRDGSWVGPTRLTPYQTPVPIGGEYVETTDVTTQYRRVVVSFAKSAVRKGANCDYPLMSQAGFSQLSDPSVSFRVNAPKRGMDEVAATIHNPNLVICRATAVELGSQEGVLKTSYEFLRSFPITIGTHGGLSSPVPMPNAPAHILVVKVYSRMLHQPKPPRPKPSGCNLTTRYYAQGFETGDAKSFSVKFATVGDVVPNTGQPWSMKATITSHTHKLTICRLNISVTVPAPNPTGGAILTKQVHIGLHGGVSSVVTFPGDAFGPEAEIYTQRAK